MLIPGESWEKIWVKGGIDSEVNDDCRFASLDLSFLNLVLDEDESWNDLDVRLKRRFTGCEVEVDFDYECLEPKSRKWTTDEVDNNIENNLR